MAKLQKRMPVMMDQKKEMIRISKLKIEIAKKKNVEQTLKVPVKAAAKPALRKKKDKVDSSNGSSVSG